MLTLTPTHFHSSSLMRVLADLEVAGNAAAGSAFAEKLGLWVSFTDAIALSALHSQPPGIGHSQRALSQRSGVGADMGDEVASVRAGLVNLITQRGTLAGGKAHIKPPEPPDASPVGAAAFEPYRRFYAAHQREMEASLGPLRARVRAVLSKNGPALKQLAALDATLDSILCERENKLLTKVASLLQKRFMYLFRTHQQALQANGQADEPALWMRNGGWLARFCQELQTVLLAELDLRLQPTLGLLEAYKNETESTI